MGFPMFCCYVPGNWGCGEKGGGGIGILPTLPTVMISVGTKKFILPPARVKIAFVIPAKHGEP